MSGAVLVTGATGFIGSHLVTACHSAGFRVTAIDRRAASVDLGPVEVVQCDADDRVLLARVRAGEFDAVCHQAGISDTLADRWDLLEDTNIRAPLRLAQACAASGTRFVYASSSSVYGHVYGNVPIREDAVDDPLRCSGPLNAYARSKLLLDQQMLRLPEKLSWMGLRYTNVFGTGEAHKGPMASILSQFVRRISAAEPIELFGDTLLAARDYLPVEVLVDTISQLLRSSTPSGVYNLGAGFAISFAVLLHWCAELAGDDHVVVRLVPNTIRDQYQYWTCADMSALRGAVPDVAEVTRDQVRRAVAELYHSFRRSHG